MTINFYDYLINNDDHNINDNDEVKEKIAMMLITIALEIVLKVIGTITT